MYIKVCIRSKKINDKEYEEMKRLRFVLAK